MKMRDIGDSWNRFWYTGTDPFGLCLIRILTGLMALYCVGTFSGELVAWFGANGRLPVSVVEELTSFRFSYLSWFHSDVELWALHVAGMIVLALFTVGLFTRITSILAIVVVLTYAHRAPMITGLVEPLLVMVLLYLSIAPSGAFLSLDRSLRSADRKGSQPADSIAANVGLRLIQIHLAGFYLMMGLMKLGGETWWSGQAVWWLIAKSESRLVDLTFLSRWEYLLNAWTHAIVIFELTFGILIWNRSARPLLLTISLVMWPSLACITGEIDFCAMMLIANLAFVPTQTLRRLCNRQYDDSNKP